MLANLLISTFLCAQQPVLADLKRALDARDDESILQQLAAIRSAPRSPGEGQEIARFLLDAARREVRLSIALELAGLAVRLDETFEGRIFLAHQELKANEYAAAAAHLDRALRLKPESRDALIERAQIARKMADFGRAAALYEKAAALGVSAASAEARACRELALRQRETGAGRGTQKSPTPKAQAPSARAHESANKRVHARQPRTQATSERRERIAPGSAPAPPPVRAQRQLALREVNDTNFSRMVHGSDKPAIVLFEAPWCRPCLALNAELARLLPHHAAQVNIVSLNIDGSPQTRQELSIRSIPQVLLFSGGSAPTPLPIDPAPLRGELERRFPSTDR